MRTNDLLLVGALGLIGWLMYRMLDQRAEAVSSLQPPEPWQPMPPLTMERIKLPLLEPDPIGGATVITDFDVVLPSDGSPIQCFQYPCPALSDLIN